MYDIKIYPNGSPIITDGDIVSCTYNEYIMQKIYRAVIYVNNREIVGQSIQNMTAMKDVLYAHLLSYLNRDSEIDISAITTEVKPEGSSNKIVYTIRYSGRMPNGEPMEFSIGIKYSVTEDGVVSIDYSPDYLRNVEDPQPVEYSIPMILTSPTTVVRMPTIPYELDGYVYLQTQNGDHTEFNELVTININEDYINYQISGYLDSYSPRIHSITSIEIVESNVKYDRIDKFGDTTLVCRDQTGYIIVSATYVSSPYITNSIMAISDKSGLSLFKLKSERYKIYASFPKTVMPGNYVLKYTGVKPGGA